MNGVGSRVRTLRKAHGLTQRVLADNAGLYHTTISELERGVTKPSLETLLKIAEVLKVDVSAFLPPAEEK